MKRIGTIGTVLFAGVLVSNADLVAQKKRVESELRNIPLPELPARAAAIVSSTPVPERSQAAVLAVQTAVGRYPASASSVVASVAKAAPESAAAVVAEATRLAPAQAKAIEIAAKPKNDSKGNGNGTAGNDGNGTPGNDGNGNNGNGGNGNGNGNGNDRPDQAAASGRPEKSALLPNGKPRPFPHQGHTDDPNHVHQPNKYNRPKPRD